MSSSPRLRLVCALGSMLLALALAPAPVRAVDSAPRWFKGNLHTHSLWSDGDDYPEMITDGYKRAGYHFLAMSDHNIMPEGQRWFALKPPAVVVGKLEQRGGGAVRDN